MTDELPGLSPTLSTDITTRQPSNTNYVLNTGFYFNIFRMPNVQYFCQEANLPGVNAGEIRQPTRFIDVKHPTTKLRFDELNVSFIVDEDLGNWRECFDWLKSIVNIEDTTDFLSPEDHYSDATLTILNSNMRENVRVKFKNCFPTNLTGLQFSTTPSDSETQTATLTLMFDSYEVEKV